MAIIQQTREFFQEVQMELRRVSFPTKQETIGATTVVIVFVIVISIFLALTDSGLARLVAWMIG
jgi:preprotein translocase subunit SecE